MDDIKFLTYTYLSNFTNSYLKAYQKTFSITDVELQDKIREKLNSIHNRETRILMALIKENDANKLTKAYISAQISLMYYEHANMNNLYSQSESFDIQDIDAPVILDSQSTFIPHCMVLNEKDIDKILMGGESYGNN